MKTSGTVNHEEHSHGRGAAAPSQRGILELLYPGKDLDEVTTSVVQLWGDDVAPASDGIYWADGSARR